MVIYVGIRLTGLVFSSWALNYPMFLTGRFIMAIGGSGGNLAAYVLGMQAAYIYIIIVFIDISLCYCFPA